MKTISRIVLFLLLSGAMGPAVLGQTIEDLVKRMEKLESENRTLKEKVARLESGQPHPLPVSERGKPNRALGNVVTFDNTYGYEILDPTTRINRKQELILEKKQSGELAEDAVILSGAVTAIADVQRSNTTSKFGYLMRHPTANNQVTKDVSEAVIHSAQLAVTANMGKWVTAYGEALYDPEQSFGAGTITALSRNQLQLRQGYVLLGNLDESPFYLSLGKMATPFGLTDTVNPFTASTVWHAFGGLAYGVKAGYLRNGLNLSVMGVQGGAQFRANNTSVDGTNIPSKLNNFVVDGNYTFQFGEDSSLLLGASYVKGSPYCQDFPVTHFSPCADENPAYDLYAQLKLGDFLFQAEYAETEGDWPGTFNPTIPQFSAHNVSSWNLGGKYTSNLFDHEIDFSVDFSRFVAGPDGSPWEKQDQLVFGVAGYLTPSVKLFSEYVRTEGYAPLNFISGDGVTPGVTHSDRSAKSDILIIGVNVAF